MTSVAIKKQLNNYIPLLTNKQQALLLEMVKNIQIFQSGLRK